jgi:hypothetical protein
MALPPHKNYRDLSCLEKGYVKFVLEYPHERTYHGTFSVNRVCTSADIGEEAAGRWTNVARNRVG